MAFDWEEYKRKVFAAENKYGLPRGMLLAVGEQETGHLSPEERLTVHSPAGAKGWFQFTDATAKRYGVDPYDLDSSIDGAARKLSADMQMFGGAPELALAAYNAGEGNVMKHGGVPPFRETQGYVYGNQNKPGTLAMMNQFSATKPNWAPSDAPGPGFGISGNRTQEPEQKPRWSKEKMKEAIEAKRSQIGGDMKKPEMGTDKAIQEAKLKVARKRHELRKQEAASAAKEQARLIKHYEERFPYKHEREDRNDPRELAYPLASGATFGFSDEIAAGGATLIGNLLPEEWGGFKGFQWKEPYTQMRDSIRENYKAFQAAKPGTSLTAEVAGGLATGKMGASKLFGAGPVKHAPAAHNALVKTLTGSPRAGKVAESVSRAGMPIAGGATAGGIAGYGYSDAEDAAGQWEDTKQGAKYGAILPAVGAVASPVIRNVRKSRGLNNIAETAPVAEELRSMSSDLYTRAKEWGMRVKSNVINRLGGNVRRFLRDEDFDPRDYPMLKHALERIDEVQGQDLDLMQIEKIRQRFNRVLADSKIPGEKRLASKIISRIDDELAGVGIDDVTSPRGVDTRQAVDLLVDARDYWKRASKTEMLQDVIYNAERGSASSGFENNLRIGFRALLRNKNKRKKFTKEEIALMEKIEAGDFSGNVARWLGRFGFGTGGSTNWLGSTLSFGGTTALTGNPIVGALPPLLGQAAKREASRRTFSNVNQALGAVSRGKTPERIYQQLANSIGRPDAVQRAARLLGVDEAQAKKILEQIASTQHGIWGRSVNVGAAGPMVGIFGEE